MPTDPIVEEAFQLLRAISFVTPAIALLLNLINPFRRDNRENIDIILFRWLLVSFTFLILAGIVDVGVLTLPKLIPIVIVKILFLLGMIIFLYPTIRLMFRKIY
jgi:hypothetical protein